LGLSGVGSGDGASAGTRLLSQQGGENELVTITSTMAKARKRTGAEPAKTQAKPEAKATEATPMPAAAVPTAAPTVTPIALPAATPPVAPRTEFSAAEAAEMLAFSRDVVRSAVAGRQPTMSLSPALASAPVYGLFVSLTRGTALRSCRGAWGGEQLFELGKLITSVSVDSAVRDMRFPRVTPGEVDQLELELNIMFDPRVIDARGADRAAGIVIGTHGLVISHPRGRGILLPHVAVQGKMNATQFCETLSNKAGLEKNAWHDDAAQIMTFSATVLTQHAAQKEFDVKAIDMAHAQELLAAGNRMLGGIEAGESQLPALSAVHPEELGVYVQTLAGQTAAAIGQNHSLLSLMQVAARSLREARGAQKAPASPIARMMFLHQPITLVASDYPARHGTLVNRGVLAKQVNGNAWALVLPNKQIPADKIGEGLAAIKHSPQHWLAGAVRVVSFGVISFDATAAVKDAVERAAKAAPSAALLQQHTRPPARAGQFYPQDAGQAAAEVDAFLAQAGKTEKRRYRAVMLPHAGWRFCGATLAKTIARTAVPDTVIIIGPKHTPHGPPWSVASHNAWAIPGAVIPVATDLVRELADAAPSLAVESDAHALEHGTEVLLPFLHRMNPNLRIVPIVLGNTAYESTAPLADALAKLVARHRAAGREILLVISSDMNHFDTKSVGESKDRTALDAMTTGNPRTLYDTCRSQQISMCGMVPAVTIMQALLKSAPTITPKLVDYSDSSAASGDVSRVVGYAGVVVE
jgi:AmmeMemoRadiSam system protein B/AmmeMemoRadiSam system protein A